LTTRRADPAVLRSKVRERGGADRWGRNASFLPDTQEAEFRSEHTNETCLEEGPIGLTLTIGRGGVPNSQKREGKVTSTETHQTGTISSRPGRGNRPSSMTFEKIEKNKERKGGEE